MVWLVTAPLLRVIVPSLCVVAGRSLLGLLPSFGIALFISLRSGQPPYFHLTHLSFKPHNSKELKGSVNIDRW